MGWKVMLPFSSFVTVSRGVPSALSPLYRANEKSFPASAPPVKCFFAARVTEPFAA